MIGLRPGSASRPTQDVLARAGRWFLRSGIQDTGGGVARYYRADAGANTNISTEITGYVASALLFLADRCGSADLAEAGLRAARFLSRTAWNPAIAAFPFEHANNGHPAEPLAYFFDSGIIIRGLLSAWRGSGDPEFLRTASAAGASMIADFRCNGTIHAIVRLPDKEPLPRGRSWSEGPGCYQLKSALAWYSLYEITRERRFLDAYGRAQASALAREPDFLPGAEDGARVMDRLHAYAYFLEGLLPEVSKPECAVALRAGIPKLERYLREIEPAFARSDVYAQLLRARLYASALGVLPLDEDAAAREAACIRAFQVGGGDLRQAGGFAFGRKGTKLIPHINPVSTAFCVQALALWEDARRGEPCRDWRALI